MENTGPQPTGAGDGAPATLSPQRTQVLDLLRRHGTLTVADLASTTGMHENTVREHLEGLVKIRLAGRERSPAAGRGRPPWRYAARPVQESTAVRDHAGLATVLAGQIARSSADPAADAATAGQDWGRALVAGLPTEPTPLAARRRVTQLLEDAGFAPKADSRYRTLRLERCPLLDAARQYPDVVCGVHTGLIQAALTSLGAQQDAAAVTLQPFAQPGACLLHLGTGRG